jgi:hypothetical protein
MPSERIRLSVFSGNITRIELHIPSVSEKNLQSIRAMRRLRRFVETAINNSHRTDNLRRADLLYQRRRIPGRGIEHDEPRGAGWRG